MNEGLFNILLACIPVLGAIITYFIIPFIKASVNEKHLAQYKQWAELAVRCAEMLWTESGCGEDKKEYVTNFLNNTFNQNKIIITEEQLNVLIESCVKMMKDAEKSSK